MVLCARDGKALAQVAAEAEQAGGKALIVEADLRAENAARLGVDRALAAFGSIDILVNNAGATRRGPFESLTDADWADGFALKFFGAVRLTRLAWPHIKARGGSVVNIAGVGGRTPGADFALGGSVNAALLSLTKSLAETGIRDGVQVNAINPGAVRTGRLARRLEALAAGRNIPREEAEREFVSESRITRIGEPEEIANLVAFVTSPMGRFLQ